MAYKFKAIDRDKKMINVKNSEKTIQSNAVYGSSNINTTFMDLKDINEYQKISLDLIKPREVNDFDNISNEGLKDSILRLGLLFPILLRTTDNGKYIIISGHRRYNCYKQIISDLNIEKAKIKNEKKDVKEIEDRIKEFESIPSIVFTVVDDNSELLGTDQKYITKDQEEEIYQASNLENRQLSLNTIAKHIGYFYNRIQRDSKYKSQLLEARNEKAERAATKLNMPKVISEILTNDLKIQVAPTYVWQMVKLFESEDEYPKYHKIAMNRIMNDNEKVKVVFNDFKKAVEIHNHHFEDDRIKNEFETRILRGKEPIEEIYNECFNIKKEVKEKDKKVSKKAIEKIITEAIEQNKNLEDVLEMIRKI